jgi:hypothetical protein
MRSFHDLPREKFKTLMQSFVEHIHDSGNRDKRPDAPSTPETWIASHDITPAEIRLVRRCAPLVRDGHGCEEQLARLPWRRQVTLMNLIVLELQALGLQVQPRGTGWMPKKEDKRRETRKVRP